jgi:branched-chain amino acid transport system permease protein
MIADPTASVITPTRLAAALLITGAVIAFGFSANNYLLQAGTTLAMSAVLCLAWNIVGGFMGYPSFGTAAFFGVGAYAGGILQDAGVPLAFAWIGAAASGAVFAALLGSVLLGLRGHYFAIGTIAVVEVMREVANNWEGLTGGAIGMNVPILAGSPREAGIFFYLAMWGLVAATFALTAIIAHSKFGFSLHCIRQNESAARMVGVAVFRAKCAAFIISGLLISLAGGVYASMVAFIEPKDVFNILLSIEVPAMVMLGGAGTILGPLIGAAVYIVLRELVWVNFINFHSAILGIIIIAVIYFMPKGLVRQFHARTWSKLTARLAGQSSASGGQ